jgi:Putative Flp pilus-assembly TadE/G-like
VADRTERGTASLLIIGLAVVLLMMAAVVTDASAAYLQRQGLDTVADGAALTAADAGASGDEAYGVGLSDHLRLDLAATRAAVFRYLQQVGAFTRYPGLTAEVSVDATGRRVTVAVRAPIRLPLHVPGSPGRATIGARSAATVGVD